MELCRLGAYFSHVVKHLIIIIQGLVLPQRFSSTPRTEILYFKIYVKYQKTNKRILIRKVGTSKKCANKIKIYLMTTYLRLCLILFNIYMYRITR